MLTHAGNPHHTNIINTLVDDIIVLVILYIILYSSESNEVEVYRVDM